MSESWSWCWWRRRGSSCSTSGKVGAFAWTSLSSTNYYLIIINLGTERLARTLGAEGVTTKTPDLMQESSPLLLPTRPSAQHDEHESNQNNAQQKRYAGRKKKRKATTLQDKVADATRLLKEQIAKANINIITSQQSHGPSAFSRRIDGTSNSEEDEDEDRPSLSPPVPLQLPEPDVVYLDEEASGVEWSPGTLPSSEASEVQEMEEEVILPRAISEVEVERLQTERILNLNSTRRLNEQKLYANTLTSQPHDPGSSTSSACKIDWGSDSEDEEDEDRPPPPIEHPVPLPSETDLNHLSDIRGPELSPRIPLSPREAQEMEEEVILPRTISESDVERLQTEQIPNLNGNYDSSGSFREWHETLRVQTYGGDELLILPYTVIDF